LIDINKQHESLEENLMNTTPTAQRGRTGLTALLSGAALVTAGLAGMAPAVADTGSVQSTEPVYATWDASHVIGSSRLVRSPNGITAVLQTTGVPSNQAITLWFIVFNNPSACIDTPCSLIDLLFNPDAAGDFHHGGGLVTGNSDHATFAGHLAVGDVSGSGREEIGMGPAVALSAPYQAEVLLAVHSHGPKQAGLALKSQLSSFTGGCAVFLGDGFGWAQEPDDMPDEPGECTTFQYSRH
jgi:hypothetical protein